MRDVLLAFFRIVLIHFANKLFYTACWTLYLLLPLGVALSVCSTLLLAFVSAFYSLALPVLLHVSCVTSCPPSSVLIFLCHILMIHSPLLFLPVFLCFFLSLLCFLACLAFSFLLFCFRSIIFSASVAFILFCSGCINCSVLLLILAFFLCFLAWSIFFFNLFPSSLLSLWV